MDVRLPRGRRAFIDTAPFIYFFEQHRVYGPLMARLIDAIYERDAEMVTSLITYIEIATLPAKRGNHALVARYRAFFTNSDRLSLQPIDLRVADETVRLRARYGLRTSDALQWAAALASGADFVVTNDRSWSRIGELPVVILDDMAV